MIAELLRLIKHVHFSIFKKNLFVGKNVSIDFGTRIYNNGNRVEIGDKVYLRSITRNYHSAMAFPTTLLLDVKNSTLKIGYNTRINGAYIHAKKEIIIGSNCVIASGVNIIDSNGHELYSGDRTLGQDKPNSIIIGDNVWIGLNAIILKNTKIGSNSVIGAGSIVKGVFPDNSLIVGNPAVVVKKLII